MDKQLDILAFGAHPDDVELGCGGTIAKQVNLGSKIGIVDLTRGELGTRGSAEIRDKEAALAAQILGVEFRHNMCFKDGFFQNDEVHQMELVKIIQELDLLILVLVIGIQTDLEMLVLQELLELICIQQEKMNGF